MLPTSLLIVLLFICIQVSAAAANGNNNATPQCKLIAVIMTRATSKAAVLKFSSSTNKTTFSPTYPLSTVNMANVRGALKYVQSEAIEKDRGYDHHCNRKNKVAFIHFYKVHVCNPPSVLRQLRMYDYFGPFLALDGGSCHSQDSRCKRLGWNDLGPYVGIQDNSRDARCPTRGAFWFSLIGACPTSPWASKSRACNNRNPSGKCKSKTTLPNGIQCTWSSEFLGQVSLDELVGITSIMNPNTKRLFKNSVEFCKAGFVEFDANEKHEFVSGLPFWKDPQRERANAERVHKLLKLYHDKGKNPNNTPFITKV